MRELREKNTFHWPCNHSWVHSQTLCMPPIDWTLPTHGVQLSPEPAQRRPECERCHRSVPFHQCKTVHTPTKRPQLKYIAQDHQWKGCQYWNQSTVSTAKQLASLFWYLIASTFDTLHILSMAMKLHVYGTQVQCTCIYDPNKCWFYISKKLTVLVSCCL